MVEILEEEEGGNKERLGGRNIGLGKKREFNAIWGDIFKNWWFDGTYLNECTYKNINVVNNVYPANS